MIRASLSARRRTAELSALVSGEQVDVLVVGGGVTGAGIALDAASRGLSVALVEAKDLAFGTSRWSSKLVHGGLRYLANGEVGLAMESARERGILLTTTAPHLTRPLPQLFPLYDDTALASRLLTDAGLHAGNLLRTAARTPGKLLPRPRSVPSAEALALVPGLRRTGLRGGLLSFDGALTDDARLVVTLARTAASFGAKVLTRLAATELRGDRVLAQDTISGDTVEIRARQVVNATGVWAGQLVPSVKLRPSRGSHLILDTARTGLAESSLLVGVAGETNRFVFLLPQPHGVTYVGLTDEPIEGDTPPGVVTAPQSDVDFLLRTASSVLDRRLGADDVIGTFAGLRPLIESEGRSADLSRKHAVLTDPDNGVITVVGGKLTTYRKMAADAVDAALASTGLAADQCRTANLPLLGAATRPQLSMVDAPARLVAKYGTEAPRVAALGEVDPELGKPLFPHCDITAAEVVWAVRHEGALDAEDVLHRRTRLGLVPSQAEAARETVADLVGRTLRGMGESG
ncbi:glycerol-3-phosphate dehydrogenase [Prauserella marina]|uniref:Glycerol-3-phosphate dehydrogenase n=1 Tax=Prauserella marina TaxID=530584 RepID=A0A222VW62_9PSEU|nr:glycerol-3-phosphate dehydrogenase/oxidase [Prauserella marina]ASR38168.1 glycerol-3-phosphate dehydrogenase [Prauserella marina]PWV78658.1 glycerol-3-phosphate dehydrogenase [Prauserella marina]SDC90929.1 glycerol-3-phosphate dehydrogenase [Prauserella marina]